MLYLFLLEDKRQNASPNLQLSSPSRAQSVVVLVTLANSIESPIRGALQATEYKATSNFCYPSGEKVTHIEAWTDALRKAHVFGSLSQDLLSTTTAEITLRKAITTAFKCPFLARFDYP
jgi:hypothetical protein